MNRKIKKGLLTVLTTFLLCLFACFTGIFCKNSASAVKAADLVTREEWVHMLVDTFQMKIEDGLVPDDYYIDISASTSSYYTDIMTAVNFGVIDLEAGEKFLPKESVSREFAAQTLNYCLGYELESDAQYTMKDRNELKYPKEDQIAVNQEWLPLINGNFLPDKSITLNEKNNMLNFAREVLSTAKIDENYDNTYEFAKGVVVVPENTRVELGTDNKVLIYDTQINLSKGDTFAVYFNGIANTYKALSISTKSDYIEVKVEEVSYDNAVTKYDAQGVVEADLEEFVPASDDIKMDVQYTDGASGQTKSSRASKRVKDIKLYKNIGGGKIGCNITSIKVNYRIDREGYLFSVSGKATASYTIAVKKDLTLPIGYINIAGIGKIQIDMIYSANGSVSLSLSSNFETGIEKEKGKGVRKIKNFTSPSWHFSAKAELKAGCKISFVIAVPAVADGTLYGETGVKASADVEVYSDGKNPKTCMDLPVYLYATAGYSVRVFGKKVVGDTIPIYTESNSPLRVCYHIEDGKRVLGCSRPDSNSRVGKRGYYSASDVSGTYGSECFVAPYEEVAIFEYELDSAGNATLTKYNGNVYALVIPDEIDGHPVTAIGENVFKGNQNLGSVIIPNSVVDIGKDAFNSCNKLADVILPKNNKYTYIEERVFANDISLNTIQMPEYITEIKTMAFNNCGLTTLHLNDEITNIGNAAFGGCAKLSDLILPKYLEIYGAACFENCSSLREVEIPRYIKENNYHPDYHAMVDRDVMRGMFYQCENLKEVRFAKGITKIPPNLFNGCTGIEKIVIPDTVTLIRSHAFNACTALTEVDLPESLTKIEVMAFRKCTSLANIHIPDAVTDIGSCAFSMCEKLVDIHLPEKLKVLGTWAFKDCVSLQTITIPKNVTEVPLYYDGLGGGTESPFVGCSKLKEVILAEGMSKVANSLCRNFVGLEKIILPDSVIQIGDSAFYNASSLKSVSLSKNLTQIGNDAFKNCSSLEKISIPDTVNKLGNNMFEGCRLLSEVKLPGYISRVSAGAFRNCTNLRKIDFPDSLLYILDRAFEGCERLDNITVPDAFKGIEQYAFLNCKRLKSADLKGNYISNNAFENCMELTDIKLSNSIENIGKAAFLNCSSVEKIHLSTGMKEISANVFEGCTYLDNLVIPYGVTDIGNEAFKDCTRLKTITIPGNVSNISISAFFYPENITVYGTKGSYAEEYANDLGMTFVAKTVGIQSIEFTKTEYSVMEGKEIKIPINILPEDCTDNVEWTSSDEKVAAIVGNGRVKGISQGECVIKVTVGNVEKTCKLVVEGALSALSLSGKTKMQVGEMSILTCTDANGQTIKAEKLRWWSGNPNVATVDQKGEVTALKKGKTTIEVWLLEDTDKKVSLEIAVTDNSISVSGIRLSKETLKLLIGKQKTLKAVISPENAENQNVSWSSSETDIATVSSNGTVTAQNEGKSIITALTEDGGFTAKCNVEVISVQISSISLNKEQLALSVGDTETLIANVLPEEGNGIDLMWTSDNENVASVDEDGNVTAVGEGVALITATVDDGDEIKGQCKVQVSRKPNADNSSKPDTSPEHTDNNGGQSRVSVTHISVSGISKKIAAGKKIKLTATVTPSNAANKSIKWKSSNKKVAKVNSSGVVTMNKKSGGKSVTITATAADGSGVKASYKIKSMKGVVKKVTISGKKTVKAGKTLKLKAKVTATKKANKKLKWTSSNKKYATVSSSGKVKALKAGKGKKVKITAMATDGSGKKKTVTIKIK